MNKPQFNSSKTFLLGLGFMGISMIWSMYNAYVPVFLEETFDMPLSLVGSIMTIDNIFAVILLPFLGALSDKTNTPLGRRRPYILLGAPLAMLFFMAIPFANLFQSLAMIMGSVILMNLSMALFRSPVIALMPDITPSKYRSQANGIINFMGGLGALLVFFGGKPLYDADIRYPFIVAGILMFLASMAVVIFVKEDTYRENQPSESKISFRQSIHELSSNLKDVFRGEKSLFFVLLAIFFWFVAFNAVETFFTIYAKSYMGLEESTGTLILGFYSVTFIAVAIPAGFLGNKIGRNVSIRIGLVALIVLLFSASFFTDFLPVAILFALAGLGWGLININSLPMVVDMTSAEKIGGYTGLYYFFSQAANIVAPPLGGTVLDIATSKGENVQGYTALLYFAALFFLLSLIIMFFVKRGESASAEKNTQLEGV